MAAFVMDASVAIAGLSADEDHRESRELVERAISDGVVVPALWPYEVANILALKSRRGTISAESLKLALRSIRDFLLTIENFKPDSETFTEAIALAQTHRLSVYDAAYVEVALRRRLPLATLDARLLAAAHAAGVAIL